MTTALLPMVILIVIGAIISIGGWIISNREPKEKVYQNEKEVYI